MALWFCCLGNSMEIRTLHPCQLVPRNGCSLFCFQACKHFWWHAVIPTVVWDTLSCSVGFSQPSISKTIQTILFGTHAEETDITLEWVFSGFDLISICPFFKVSTSIGAMGDAFIYTPMFAFLSPATALQSSIVELPVPPLDQQHLFSLCLLHSFEETNHVILQYTSKIHKPINFNIKVTRICLWKVFMHVFSIVPIGNIVASGAKASRNNINYT